MKGSISIIVLVLLLRLNKKRSSWIAVITHLRTPALISRYAERVVTLGASSKNVPTLAASQRHFPDPSDAFSRTLKLSRIFKVGGLQVISALQS